ncbi:Putative metallophosphoesterase MG207 homolog [Alloiococcus otitis]|uniref:Phosphoesterase n=1 Tax=Alloiococcus otitis ATCC 51267 TaxID=883081 RepID=K9E7C3_9LACT|nr:metallophosphoesterase [Alloiococcus otitis]EKU93084.1 MJ0936 family phosphodiesterase [Alloiococcus otitis ATCC 51267]SUU80768.1 Putative metallophosphoesterase MG207 homolog [Alloiococcus otitis]
MKILAISDNHGDETILEQVLSIHETEVDSFIHCGDSELSDVHPLWQQYSVVKGNTDFGQDLKDGQVDKVDGRCFFITHGHLYDVKRSRKTLAKAAKEAGAQFAFYGHTHIPKVETIDGVHVINPGSISLPKGEFPHGTYCILDIKDDQTSVTYYTRDHQPVPELSQTLA